MSADPQTDSPVLPAAVAERLASLADNLTDGLLLMDAEWRITYANSTARRISQIAPESLNGPTLWQIYPALDNTEASRIYREVVRTGVEQTLNGFYYAPLDTVFDIRVLPMFPGIALHYRDVVSDVRAARAAEIATTEQLQQVMDATADGILSIDRKWSVTFANHSALAITAPSGDILGRNFWEFFPDARQPGTPFVEHYERAMNEGSGGNFEAFYPGPLNVWVDVTVQPSRNGIILFFRDITKFKLEGQALRESEERYRVLAELSPQSLWTAGPSGLVLYANRRFLEYIGQDFVPKTGEEYIQCFDERDRALVVQVWTHSVTTGEDYSIDARLIRAADGASRWWHLRALPVRDAEGNITLWLGTGNDIHDVRAINDQLREQMAQQKRAEAALIQSEKLAAVGRMASSIAHEINNPLESITNLVYLARQNAIKKDVQTFLDLAEQELRRVSIIANQTLRFHKQSTFAAAIDCRALFAAVLALYEGRLRNASVHVEMGCQAEEPVVCFEGDMRQVLSNLVGNAIDAMPHGGRLLLRSRLVTEWSTGRKGVAFIVADTGSGIPPEAQAHIFDAFFTTKGITGTGLGLWVSSEIMQRHGGRIRMRSSHRSGGTGTVFSLFLPLQT